MISVIIPVYNVKDYLHECVDSIISQSYTDLEIILVDDGSTDGSGKICEDYAGKDARIRVIHQKNQGLSAARNTGLEHMTGQYLTFLDSDDYLLPTALEDMLSLAKAHEADMVVFPFLRLEEDGQIFPYKNHAAIHETEVFDGADKMASYITLHKQTNTVCGKLYSKELFETIRFPVGKVAEDVFVSYQVIHAAKRIVINEKPQYVYRNRSGSIITCSCNARDYDVIEGRNLEATFIIEHYPELERHMHIKVCNAATELTVRSARAHFSHPEKDKVLQKALRENLKYYIKYDHRHRRKVIAFLGACSLKLARVFVRILS